MPILDEFDIQHGDIVSIVGAGGKTTLMFKLAEALRARGTRVLVSTTTKIHVPTRNQYDHTFIGEDAKLALKQPLPGITVIGADINHRGKLTSFDNEDLRRFSDSFDITLIEADGARERLLKAWSEHEPAVPGFSTKTIAVFNLALLNKLPNEADIHRLPLFLELCELAQGEPISRPALRRLLTKPDGILRGASGKRILYINHVHNKHTRREAIEFIESFAPGEISCFDRVVIES